MDDAEVAAGGGPTAHSCGACQSVLDDIDVALDIGNLDSGSSAADDMSGSPVTLQQEALVRPGESTQPNVDQMAPPGQLIIGEGSYGIGPSTRATLLDLQNNGDKATMTMKSGAQPMITGGSSGAWPNTGQIKGTIDPTLIDAERPQHLQAMMAARSAGTATTIQPHAAPPQPAPEAGLGRSMGLAVGCMAIAAVLLVLAGAGFGAYALFFQDEQSQDNPNEENADNKAIEVAPERPPLGERLHEMVSGHSGTSVPAIRLPAEIPEASELVLLTPNGIVFDNDMVATISIGRVDPNALPKEGSPWIQPLAKQLEAAWDERIKDEIDAEAEPRVAVILGDGSIKYTVVYSALYTSWERGAKLLMAAVSPSNPNAYVAVPIVASGWPAPLNAGVLDAFEPKNPSVMPDTNAKVMTVTIHDKGFEMIGPDPKDKPIKSDESMVFPVQALKEQCRAVRTKSPEITAVLIKPSKRTSLFTLLQTISALQGRWGTLEPLKEIRLAKPQ